MDPNLSNWFLAWSKHLSDRNCLTAWDLDSPIDFASRFLGRGTTNLPLSALEWLSQTWCTMVHSSGERIESLIGLSSISQNLHRMLSPETKEVWYVVMRLPGAQDSVSPARIQPNSVSKATGDPGGPNHQPWSNTLTNTSTPRRMVDLSRLTEHSIS